MLFKCLFLIIPPKIKFEGTYVYPLKVRKIMPTYRCKFLPTPLFKSIIIVPLLNDKDQKAGDFGDEGMTCSGGLVQHLNSKNHPMEVFTSIQIPD